MATKSCAISSGSPETTAAGQRIAELGGNAVDIAVGAALTATVAEILFCSLGGSAYIMLHIPGHSAELIDGGDAMPSVPPADQRNPDGWFTAKIDYGDGIEIQGGHAAVGVPGALASLELAWQRHGSLPWSELVQPALELSRTRYPAGKTMATWLAVSAEPLFSPQPASRACFFPDGDEPVKAGDLFQIPDMPKTLELIADEGAAALYQGELGQLFSGELLSHGGFVTREDLASYRAKIRRPILLKSGGFELALNPPPAVGGSALATLVRAAENNPWPEHSSEHQIDLMARAQGWLVDLREGKGPGQEFDPKFAYELLNRDDFDTARTSLKSPSTTHISVATSDGALVSITMSMGYGSGITIPGTGIACNNSLGEPELNPRGYFTIPIGERMLSNMTPTVAWHPDGRTLAIGSPGANRITSAVANTWFHHAFNGLSYFDAVEAPRLHVERIRDKILVQYEPGLRPPQLERQWELSPFTEKHMYFGAVKLAGRNAAGHLEAVADSRRHGAAVVTHA
jgi:gamma-glutamyltranspeptidase/glutathione hydrolase